MSRRWIEVDASTDPAVREPDWRRVAFTEGTREQAERDKDDAARVYGTRARLVPS